MTAILALVLIATGPVRPSPQAPAPGVEATLLALHNAERVRARLPPLALDKRLSAAAAVQAADCARRGRLDHRGADGSTVGVRVARQGYAYAQAGENAGWAPKGPLMPDGTPWFPHTQDPDAMVRLWMSSPGHRAAILGPQYRDFGAAVARDARDDAYFICAFGRKR